MRGARKHCVEKLWIFVFAYLSGAVQASKKEPQRRITKKLE
jgi:hypothetical protein